MGLSHWSSRVLLALGTVGLVGGLVACGVTAKEDVRAGGSSVTEATFDRNAVLDDKSLRDHEAMTVTEIQSFLDETPWGTKSVLADYEEGGKSAAQIIADKAEANGINPLELLVRVQMEQGLISKTTASEEKITLAFGCGCPHSPVCGPKYEGFANQAECAAGTLRRSMDKATTATGTVSGWAKSRAKATEDGLTVTPKNAATAALYTYTPYVGEAGGGRDGVGGVSLHHQVWTRFAEFTGYGAAAAPQAPRSDEADSGATPARDAGADTGANTPDEEEGESPEGENPPKADAGSDAGPKKDKAGDNKKSDSSDDDEILGEGNAPPSSNGAPPRATGGKGKAEDLPLASEEELAGKKKSTAGGCSTSGTSGGSSAAVIGLAVAAVLVNARRKKR